MIEQCLGKLSWVHMCSQGRLTANAPSYLHNFKAANNTRYSVYPNDCNTLEKADENVPCIVIDFEIIHT